MTARKAAFFDIDGTIWNYSNEIPQSTIDAIRELRKNGHLAFICSGRSRAFIRSKELLDIGFDGIVSGCGTMIEYKDEIVFNREIEPDFMEKTLGILRKYGFRPILEGRTYLYMDEKDFGDEAYGKKVKAEMGEMLRTIEECWGKWEVNKFSCATDHADRKSCFQALEPYYDFLIHTSEVAEIVPKGFNKGTGIQKVCELLDLEIENTFAFGDSINDLAMLQTAGVSVAMGDGSPEAKKAADYVTADLMDDGIYKACRHFGLI